MLCDVQAISENSSKTDLCAVVDKKSSTPGPGPSMHPFHRNNYEDIDDELPPELSPNPPPPYQLSNSRPNGRVSPKVPAPYQSSVSNREMRSLRKIGKLHSNSVDILLSNTGYVMYFN